MQKATGTPYAQRAAGAVANVTATPAGSLGTTLAANGFLSGLGEMTTNTPELPAVAVITMCVFQIIKHLPFVKQNRDQVWILPLLALALGFVGWYLQSHGDIWAAATKAYLNSGFGAIGAATTYKTIKPMGVFGPAAD